MRPAGCGHALEPATGLVQVAALLPEPPHGESDTDGCGAVAGEWRAVQDGTDVVVLQFEAFEDCTLVRSGQLWRGCLHEIEIPTRVERPDGRGLWPLVQHLRRELADGLDHDEAGWIRIDGAEQALVGESHEAIEDVDGRFPRWHADDLGRIEAEPSFEHREAIEEQPVGHLEDLIAPGDRPAQRLLPRGQVTGPGCEQGELVFEPGEDRIGTEQLDPGGGKLDGQGHALEPRADRRHCRGIRVRDGKIRADRNGPGDEQADRLVRREGRQIDGAATRHADLVVSASGARIRWHRQARDGILLLAGHAQRRAGCREDGEPGRATKEVRNDGARIDDLLEVVEHEQDLLAREPLDEHLEAAPSAGLGEPDLRRDP